MSQENEPGTEKKIIVDEDWKSQVQAERDRGTTEPPKPEPDKPSPKAAQYQLPPASLSFLISTIATQALIALGQVPNPVTDKAEPDVGQAKHFIDMLGVIEEKTKGNLTAQEKQQLETVLFELRLQFVELKRTVTANQ